MDGSLDVVTGGGLAGGCGVVVMVHGAGSECLVLVLILLLHISWVKCIV